VRRLVSIVAALAFAGSAALLAQMPDLRQMSGQPLPSADLPAGTVSVRVVRQTIANNVSGVAVELAPASGTSPAPRSVATDAGGRAVFAAAPAGVMLKATAIVDGERLESHAFAVPGTGGLRILLAAGLGAGAAAPGAVPAPMGPAPMGPAPMGAAPIGPAPTGQVPAGPAAPGSIVLGGQSRIILELAEGSLEVFCLVDVLNTSASAVTLSAPIVFEAPANATNATLLEGSTPLAKIEGPRATIVGPLPAGATSLQFAYRVPTPAGSVQFRQVLPLAASQLTVIVRKFNDLTVTMSNEGGRREAPIEGRTYLVLNGGAVNAGGGIDLAVDGLPAHSSWPRYLALGLAALVVIVGVWAIASGASPDTQDVARLRADRAQRFGELVALERRVGGTAAPDAALLEQRSRLIGEIAELDLALEPTAPPADAGTPGKTDAVRTAARASTAQ
jgi:hypothetical protein